MANRFVLNTISYHGSGAIKEIPGELQRRGYKKIFVCSDPDLVKFGVTAKVTDELDAAGIAWSLYSEIKPNPTIQNVKDGVEAHLQALLAEHLDPIGTGLRLVRREYMTAIGPVDILCRDADGHTVAVEIKRRGEIDGVEQLTRYLELLNRDTTIAPVAGVFAAQQIKPQARTLAEDRGIRCVVLDYDELRGAESNEFRLF